MIKNLYSIVSLLIVSLVVMPQAWAGCPYMPEESASLKIIACRFYNAAEDKAFIKEVDAYFSKGWDGLSDEQIFERKRQTVLQNTGAFITGLADKSEQAQQLFLQGLDEKLCENFIVNTAHKVSIRKTCRMVLFEAPLNLVMRVLSD